MPRVWSATWRITLATAALATLVACDHAARGEQEAHKEAALPRMAQDYPIRPVPFTRVHVDDAFWSPRLEMNRTVTIPYAFKKCEETGRISNFAVAGGLAEGTFRGTYFNDSDVYKVLEGAAYALANHRDPGLERYVDDLIAKIAAAQEDDGYLYTSRTILNPKKMPPGGKERWSNISGGHELYCVGHLYEAAVAHYQATGKRTLIDVALANADLICRVFGPDGRHDPPGHQEIEIGLAKLYRITGERKYLALAKFFLDARGRKDGRKRLYGAYSQDHKPVVEQTEAVGHAVRAAYMYSGLADIAALTGDASYTEAIGRIWHDVVGAKMYVTGGIGARGGGEGFGKPYELPNSAAYCETCASIAHAMWNHRMFLIHGDAKYLDVLERAVYNAFLGGVSIEGNRFFYANRLESFRGERRAEWFGCACCPSNVCRFVPSIPGYVYAHRGGNLYVNLFIAGTGTVEMAEGTVRLTQATRYPWEGTVTITVAPERPGRFAVLVRIPGWARNRPVPSDLYRYVETSEARPTLKVNGREVPLALEKGFARVERQ
ncbi:MAG: glycoside hydrolase family 127 protein, partial [Planctomycetota bacterium]|nr:glycoside hydrolase family 127 protein [Planctomycetota bacterium]